MNPKPWQFQPGNKLGERRREYAVRIDDLRKMRAAGMGAPAIAKVYGCHHTTVLEWLKRFDLPTTLKHQAPEPSAIDAAIAAAKRKTASLPSPKVS